MKKPALPLAALALLCLLAVGASLFLGGGWRHPGELLAPEQRGLLSIRGWRVALGAVVGASLAGAGVIFQAVLRNPLADPYVLGVSAGAGLATATGILFGLGAASLWLLPAAGLAGSLASLAIVYALARIGRRTSAHTLILAGVVWGSLCGSILMFLISQSTAEGLHAILWWFLGDLQVYTPALAGGVMAANAALLLAATWFARDLNALTLGDDVAGHVGLQPERAKAILLALGAGLAATCVCASGLIAFAGLVIPHAARALVGSDHRRLLPAAMALGAAFLAVADGIGRTLLYPLEIPVGIFTSLVGAPFFLLLLRQRQRDIWL